jgi:hypothetical protein
VPNDLVSKVDPAVAGDDLHEVLLDLFGIFFARKAQPAGHAFDVGVDHDPAGDAKRRAQHYVGGFSRHAGQRDQRLHRPGNLAVVLGHQPLGGFDQVSRLGAKKPGGMDNSFKLHEVSCGQRHRVWVTAKQLRRHHVDALVGRLRAENGRNQQLVRRLERELAHRVAPRFVQGAEDGCDSVAMLTFSMPAHHAYLVVLTRTTICAVLTVAGLTVVGGTGCGASRKEVNAAQTSGYDADFAIVFSETLAAVQKLYPHLDENPSAGWIKTAWHQLRIRQSDDGNPGGQTTGPPLQGNASSPLLSQDSHPGGKLYFVRFDVYVLGGKPWRIRVEGQASEWEAGMKQSPLRGAATPQWLKGRVEGLQVAIYRRLKRHAVPLSGPRPPPVAARTGKIKAPRRSYGDIPAAAAVVIDHCRSALLAGNFAQVRGFMADDFVWSEGGAPGADEAIIVWRADPTLVSQVLAAFDQGCVTVAADKVVCPGRGEGGYQAQLVVVGGAWKLQRFTPE